jgi:hypothetical protein
VDVSIGTVTARISVSDAPPATGPLSALGEDDLDRLAELLMARMQRASERAAARSLAPEDPAGGLDRWG